MIAEQASPAKIILFGEHAVVYDKPAIAAPVTSLRARVRVHEAEEGAGMVIESEGNRQYFRVERPEDPESINSLVFAALLTLDTLGIEEIPDLNLMIRSDIPLGRGLGSGAAVSASIISSLGKALGHKFDKQTLNNLVYEVEKKHHGTPSGIDNTVVVHGRPVYFVRGKPIEPIKIARPFVLLIGDTGYGTPTHVPVGDVRRLYEAEPERIGKIFDRIGEIATEARIAIQNGDVLTLGKLMNENHDLLQRLTVSSVELDFLCEIAVMSGALGAKLSGGGRGGNMIALVRDSQVETVMNALHSAGASRVVKTRIRPMAQSPS